jgi:hypothetical protein
MTAGAPLSRHARWWMPAWPALGAFFAAALLLSSIAHHATTGAAAAAEANWAGFVSHMAVGMAAAVLVGVASAFLAGAAVRAELGLRRRSYGAKSLSTCLLAMIAAFLVGLIAENISIEAHGIYRLHDPIDFRIMPVLLFALVAWPIGHLVGLGYGAAALYHRGERLWLGLVGICCNLLALPVWYVSVLDPRPVPPIF